MFLERRAQRDPSHRSAHRLLPYRLALHAGPGAGLLPVCLRGLPALAVRAGSVQALAERGAIAPASCSC